MLRTERDYWDSGGSEILQRVGFLDATYDYASRYLPRSTSVITVPAVLTGKTFQVLPSAAVAGCFKRILPSGQPTLTFLQLRASYGKVGNDKMGGARFLYLDDITMETVSLEALQPARV